MPCPLLFNAVYLQLVFKKPQHFESWKRKLSLMQSVLGILPTSLVSGYVTGLQHLTARSLSVSERSDLLCHMLCSHVASPN